LYREKGTVNVEITEKNREKGGGGNKLPTHLYSPHNIIYSTYMSSSFPISRFLTVITLLSYKSIFENIYRDLWDLTVNN